LRFPPGSLVILTGLPGAGKTTLLRRLYGLHGAESLPVTVGTVVVIDTYQSKQHWHERLGWAPGPLRRAVVFVTHLSRIRRALVLGHSIIAHNRGCAPYVLRGFAWLARRPGTGRASTCSCSTRRRRRRWRGRWPGAGWSRPGRSRAIGAGGRACRPG
jgi:hypothetical protein